MPFVSIAAALVFLVPMPVASASASVPVEGPVPEHAVVAFLQDYFPSSQIKIKQGDAILFADLDPTAGPGHSFTEDVPEGVTPKFDSDIVPPGFAKKVPNVPSLAPGMYKVRCKIHVVVRGTLTVG